MLVGCRWMMVRTVARILMWRRWKIRGTDRVACVVRVAQAIIVTGTFRRIMARDISGGWLTTVVSYVVRRRVRPVTIALIGHVVVSLINVRRTESITWIYYIIKTRCVLWLPRREIVVQCDTMALGSYGTS